MSPCSTRRHPLHHEFIERIPLSDGTSLDGHWLTPKDKEYRAVLFLGHAMMVDGKTMVQPINAGIASQIAHHGIGVAVINFRGHTKRGLRAGPNGYNWGYDDLVNIDMPGIVDWMRSKAKGLPLFVGGHSLAGHVSLAALSTGMINDIQGWIGIASAVWRRQDEPSLRRWWTKRINIEALSLVSKLEGFFHTTRWGMGTVPEACGYIEDLANFARLDRWASRDGRLDYHQLARQLELPILYVTGSSDRLFAPVQSVQGFMMGVGSSQTHIHTHDNGNKRADHMGLILHKEFSGMWDEVGQWLLQQL